MPCNLDLYPLEFSTSQVSTGTDAIAEEVDDLQYTAEAIAIALLQNQRAYGYNLSMLQDATGGGGLNALMPLTIVSGANIFVPPPKGTKGYWGGGQYLGGLLSSHLDRFTFSDKSISRIGISFAKLRMLAGTTASKNNGYWGGGSHIDLDRLTFLTEALTTVGTLATSPPYPSGHIAGVTALLAGYMISGVNASNALNPAIEKITFATDAVTLLSAVVPTATWGHVGVSSVAAGYSGGGYTTQSVGFMHKLLYSTEAVSLMGVSLASPRRSVAGLSSDAAGYFAAGLGTSGFVGDGLMLASIEKLNYAGDGMSILGSAFGTPHWVSEGMGSNSYGYVGGGGIRINSSYLALRTIYELAYIGESLTLLGTGLSDARWCASAVSDFSPAMGL